ncbi:MAG TPA: hypothetical protein DD730_18580 [Desulfosporosinus sp.]|jgi:hypothetical protein|nr:hypothetical protein [Desulfosporosinus sp.]
MIIGTFIFYFVLFIVFFSLPGLRNKEKSNTLFKFLAIPALFAVGMAFLSLIKVYFVYKLLGLVFILVTGLLSYWQWGQQIRRWWN